MPHLPEEFLNTLRSLPDLNVEAFQRVHEAEEKITSVRINPAKPVARLFEGSRPVQWCDLGFYLSERPNFTHDPLFHAGCYYVQEAGSMFVAHLLKQTSLNEDLRVLDLCAAPGGKSTLALSMLSKNSVLVSNEIVRQRCQVLAENLGRWGHDNVIVTNNDPEVFGEMPSLFDVVMVDAPCSGSGLFRKQPDAVMEWNEQSPGMCAARQRQLLPPAVASLKEGGWMIYSTCSYSVEENEAMVEWLVRTQGMEHVPVEIEKQWGIVESSFGFRFYPHLVASEGFFAALLRKRADGGKSGHTASVRVQPALKEKSAVVGYVGINAENLMRVNDRLCVLPEAVQSMLRDLPRGAFLRKCGVNVGEIMKGELVPEQELAWYAGLSRQTRRVELDRQNAVKYLKKETFRVDAEKGIALMSYEGWGLGWAKVLEGRVNNYLPVSLRILK